MFDPEQTIGHAKLHVPRVQGNVSVVLKVIITSSIYMVCKQAVKYINGILT